MRAADPSALNPASGCDDGRAQQDSASLASTQAAGVKTGFSLPGECLKAAEILKAFLADPASPRSALNAIPKAVLLRAKGLAVFSVVKAGFVFSGKGGTGVVVARLPDGSWSAPSLIMTGGLGWGLQIGADITVRLACPHPCASPCPTSPSQQLR